LLAQSFLGLISSVSSGKPRLNKEVGNREANRHVTLLSFPCRIFQNKYHSDIPFLCVTIENQITSMKFAGTFEEALAENLQVPL